jgi:hypothetical protein
VLEASIEQTNDKGRIPEDPEVRQRNIEYLRKMFGEKM